MSGNLPEYIGDKEEDEGELLKFAKRLPSLTMKLHALAYGCVVLGIGFLDFLIFKRPIVSVIVGSFWGIFLGGHYLIYRLFTSSGRERERLAREDVKRNKHALSKARFKDREIQSLLKEVRKFPTEYKAPASRAAAVRSDILELAETMGDLEKSAVADVLDEVDEACALVFGQLRRARNVENSLRRHNFKKMSKEIEMADRMARQSADEEIRRSYSESAQQLREQWGRLGEVARLHRRLLAGADEGARLLSGIHVDLTRMAASSEDAEVFARSAGQLEATFSKRLEEIGLEVDRAIESVEEVRRVSGGAGGFSKSAN